MYRKIRKLLIVLILTALLVLCIAGIWYIDKTANDQYADLSLESAQENTYTSWSIFYPSRMDLKKILSADGVITSPKEEFLEELVYSGSIEEMAVSEGEGFAAGDLLFDGSVKYYAKYAGIVDLIYEEGTKVHIILADYEDRYVSAQVPEEYLPYLSLGGEISFLYLGEGKTGIISYVSSYVTDGTVTVRIDFSDEELSMCINASVSVQVVEAQADDVLAVPENALIQSADVYYLRVKSGDESILKEVTTGITSSDGYVEIKEGITESDVILIDPAASASETEDS